MSERGAATVEHAGLSLLIALVAIAALVAVGRDEPDAGRELGSALARKLRCAAAGPGPCWRDPLTLAYGRSLAGAVRALAPPPSTRAGSGGTPLLPVDFRRCRTPGCAVPGSRSPALTASNRRTTAFVAVAGDGAGGAEISYWLYRPTLGWEEIRRAASAIAVAAHASVPLLESAVPVLVPLETLAGRNHYDFPPAEEPPWRWQVESVFP